MFKSCAKIIIMKIKRLLDVSRTGYLIALFILLMASGCHPEMPDRGNRPAEREADPPQYGTPFAGVPDPRDAVIYQVNIRSFSPSRNFQGVIARLDSIKSLGANVVYLMPIHPVGTLKAFNSPYCVKDHMAVNPDFGTLQDLRRLIEEAHKRDMAVILDWVANHTSWDHVWMTKPTWYARDGSGNILIPNNWNDVAQLNFDNTDMRAAMIKAMKYWVLASNCDGFRCDYSDGPPMDFWEQAIDSLNKIPNRQLLMLAEGTRSQSFGAGFDYTFGFRFYDQLRDVFQRNRPATNFNTTNALEYNMASPENRVVRYTTNHDVNSSDGTPLDLFGGRQGSMAAFVIASYMRGVPMVYNGQEVGTSFRLTFPFMGPTIDWSRNPDMVAEYKKIIALWNRSAALRRGVPETFSNQNVCAFTKTTNLETVFVAVNVRNSPSVLEVPANLAETEWKDAFTGQEVSLHTMLNMAPYAYLVYKK